MNRAHDELDADGFREWAFFALTGAYFFGSNTIYVPTAAGGDGKPRQASSWPLWVTCAVWVAIFSYLGLTVEPSAGAGGSDGRSSSAKASAPKSRRFTLREQEFGARRPPNHAETVDPRFGASTVPPSIQSPVR